MASASRLMIVVADGSSLCTVSLSDCRSSCLNPCSWTHANPDRHPPAACSAHQFGSFSICPVLDSIFVVAHHEPGMDGDSLQVEISVRVGLQSLWKHALVSASYHRYDAYA